MPTFNPLGSNVVLLGQPKNRIAGVIAERLPELAPWQPPFRKPWMSEDERMSIFDAVAFALTFFYFTNKQ